jgi:hypothetical protein
MFSLAMATPLLRPVSLLQLLVEPPTGYYFIAGALRGISETCRRLYNVRWLRFYCLTPTWLSILCHDKRDSELPLLYRWSLWVKSKHKTYSQLYMF